MEWSGVEWSGVEWSGVECSGVEWSGVEWSGVEWSDSNYEWVIDPIDGTRSFASGMPLYGIAAVTTEEWQARIRYRQDAGA